MAGVNKQLWKDHIVTDPDILAGKPVIAGTRISVELIFDCLASGWNVAEFIENYPHVLQQDVLVALEFAADVMRVKPFITVDEIQKGKQF